MLLVRVRLDRSPIHGLGVFADEAIAKGQAVWRFTPGLDLAIEPALLDGLAGPQREALLHYGYLDARTKQFVLCCDDARFLNHSGTPSLATDFTDDRYGVDRAARDIAPGEELTVDYALLEGSPPEGERPFARAATRRRATAVLRGAALYFGIVFAVGFVLGAVRVPFLVPWLGERAAELAEMPLMFIAVFLAAGHVVRKYGASVSGRSWALVGMLALALLVCAELLLAVALAGRGVGEYIAGRDPVSGSVYLGMLLLFAAMPWLRRGLGGGRDR